MTADNSEQTLDSVWRLQNSSLGSLFLLSTGLSLLSLGIAKLLPLKAWNAEDWERQQQQQQEHPVLPRVQPG